MEEGALRPLMPLALEMRSLIGRMRQRPFHPGQGPTYLNLGSGRDRFPGFVGVDLFGSGADLECDLRRPLPMADDSIAGIFSEHAFEHLSYDVVAGLLVECQRVMAPGAYIRIVVPDVSIFVDRYARGDDQWFAEWEREVLAPRGRRLPTKMAAISFVTQEYGHVSCWDFDTMKYHLEQAGFGEVEKVGFRSGKARELLVEREQRDRTMLSLYVEARKPRAT
jgi:predicted SAM-dependent methyltransferase